MPRRRGRPRLAAHIEDRDRRVKALLMRASGGTNAEVAAALDVAPRTVQLWTSWARTNERLARVAEVLPRVIKCIRDEIERESAFS